MKGLVLSLKPFKSKQRNVIIKEERPRDKFESREIKRNTSGRGFFRDSSGNFSNRETVLGEEFPKRNENIQRQFLDRHAEIGSALRNETTHKARISEEDMEISLGILKARENENLKKYGMSVLFAFMILLGVIAGKTVSLGIDSGLMENFKFLMFTDMGAEGTNGSLQVFSSAFAVNFIYLTFVFLIGLSPWGMGVIPFVCLLKGFETGLVASYLSGAYDWGAAYYFLIIAPGLFVFALSLIIQSGYAVRISSALGSFMFTSRKGNELIKDDIKTYMYRSGTMMILATVAALVNTVMWTVCINTFDL